MVRASCRYGCTQERIVSCAVLSDSSFIHQTPCLDQAKMSSSRVDCARRADPLLASSFPPARQNVVSRRKDRLKTDRPMRCSRMLQLPALRGEPANSHAHASAVLVNRSWRCVETILLHFARIQDPQVATPRRQAHLALGWPWTRLESALRI